MDWDFWTAYMGGAATGISLFAICWALVEWRDRRRVRIEVEDNFTFVTKKGPLTAEDINRVYEQVEEQNRIFAEIQRRVGSNL
jgi:hypothetical protein